MKVSLGREKIRHHECAKNSMNEFVKMMKRNGQERREGGGRQKGGVVVQGDLAPLNSQRNFVDPQREEQCIMCLITARFD